MTWVLLAISLVVGWAVPTQSTGGQAASGTPQASSGTPAAAVDGPSVRRRFDEARWHFLTGYYRHAFEEFSDLAGADDEELATSASIAMADCQMEWGDYEGALDTLQSVRESARAPDDIGTGSAHGSGSARWHRAAAAAYSKLGDYDKAIEYGQQALKLDDDHMRARYELGRLYETVGRWDDAIHTYQYFDKLLAGEARFPETAEDAHYAGVGFYRYSVLTRSEHLIRRTKYVVQEVLQPACEILDL